ncbi:MAG: hypothetical protein V7733_22475 [Paraglaciecola polaris]|uniref:hypothetical protein n=1 Tax=Paraglaciecola polaris TaxID=222814 RepID=UPI003002F81C
MSLSTLNAIADVVSNRPKLLADMAATMNVAPQDRWLFLTVPKCAWNAAPVSLN